VPPNPPTNSRVFPCALLRPSASCTPPSHMPFLVVGFRCAVLPIDRCGSSTLIATLSQWCPLGSSPTAPFDSVYDQPGFPKRRSYSTPTPLLSSTVRQRAFPGRQCTFSGTPATFFCPLTFFIAFFHVRTAAYVLPLNRNLPGCLFLRPLHLRANLSFPFPLAPCTLQTSLQTCTSLSLFPIDGRPRGSPHALVEQFGPPTTTRAIDIAPVTTYGPLTTLGFTTKGCFCWLLLLVYLR